MIAPTHDLEVAVDVAGDGVHDAQARAVALENAPLLDVHLDPPAETGQRSARITMALGLVPGAAGGLHERHAVRADVGGQLLVRYRLDDYAAAEQELAET